MASKDSSQEKTEQPTPKRLREARKKGQVFKSRDLETVMVFIAAVAALAFTKTYMAQQLQLYMEEAFRYVGRENLGLGDMYELGKMGFLTMVRVTAPVIITAAVAAAVVGFLQVGPVFSMEPLKPQMKKLNAIENAKNMLKPKIFFELIKNILKIVIIFVIAYTVLKGMLEPFLLTVTAPVDGSARLGGMVVVRFLIRFLIIFLMVAVMDLYIQRKEYIKNLKMSKDEVKREYKEDEGDPLIKSHRRQLHMEMAMGDVRGKVKKADAVVTNPTHLAVAIQYDKAGMVAPQVVAKGQRLFAEFIKDIAKENDVPIIRNVPLAWALMELDLDEEIPEKLYVAVAEILTIVYRLKEEKEQGRFRQTAAPRPEAPRSFPQLGKGG